MYFGFLLARACAHEGPLKEIMSIGDESGADNKRRRYGMCIVLSRWAWGTGTRRKMAQYQNSARAYFQWRKMSAILFLLS